MHNKRSHILINLLTLFLVLLISGFQDIYSENLVSVSRKYDVHFYFVDVEVIQDSAYISGSNRIDAIALDNLDQIELDVSQSINIDSILLNGVYVDYNRKDDTIFIDAVFQIGKNEPFSLTVYYDGTGKDEKHRGGLFNQESQVGTNATWTLSEPFSTKAWLPCKEDLNDKADSVYVFITVPEQMLAGSVGLLTNVTEIPGGKKRFEWKSNYPIAYYLISIAAGYYNDYTFYTQCGSDSLPVVNYIYNDSNYFIENKSKIDETAIFLQIFGDLFGSYPFIKEKYGHCVAPMGGGMEHQTMTTLTNFNYELVAHELAHQWFGNHVTCSNWQDIWINEGFASYGEYLAYEFMGLDSLKREWILESQKGALEERTGSIFVPIEEVNDEKRIFEFNLTYNKGACIIHMIRHELNNDELFFSVLKEFQNKYSFENASGNDFKNLLESMSGKSFDNFFNEWYYGEGYPEMEIYWAQKNDTLLIINTQKPTALAKTSLFHSLVEYLITYGNNDTAFVFRQENLIDTFKVYFPQTITGFETDPNNYLLKKVLFQKRILYDGPMDPKFIIYPNPTLNKVTVEPFSQTEVYDVSVFFSDGRLKEEYLEKTGLLEINTSKYTEGIYILRIRTKEGLQTSQRIIKK